MKSILLLALAFLVTINCAEFLRAVPAKTLGSSNRTVSPASASALFQLSEQKELKGISLCLLQDKVQSLIVKDAKAFAAADTKVKALKNGVKVVPCSKFLADYAKTLALKLKKKIDLKLTVTKKEIKALVAAVKKADVSAVKKDEKKAADKSLDKKIVALNKTKTVKKTELVNALLSKATKVVEKVDAKLKKIQAKIALKPAATVKKAENQKKVEANKVKLFNAVESCWAKATEMVNAKTCLVK